MLQSTYQLFWGCSDTIVSKIQIAKIRVPPGLTLASKEQQSLAQLNPMNATLPQITPICVAPPRPPPYS
jgi:hypothetical protein